MSYINRTFFTAFCAIGSICMISSCTSAQQSERKRDELAKSLIAKYCTQRMELRDSLYFIYTVRYWRKLPRGFGFWQQRSRLYFMNDDSDIKDYISFVFYSPDRKKLVFALGEKLPNAQYRGTLILRKGDKEYERNRMCPYGPDTIYTLTPMFAIRDSINQPWKISVFFGVKIDC